MPKKSKKGGGKSEEERLVQLQQRAQAEEELARRKEETLTLFLKDKLQKEQRNSAVNLLKLNEGWRSILRQSREAELRTEVAVCRQTFDRQLDARDSAVEKLVRELQEAERQAAQVQRAHLQHVDRLQELLEQQLRAQQRQWEVSLQSLSSRFGSERARVRAESQQQRVKLEDLLESTEQRDQDQMGGIHDLYKDSLLWLANAHEDEMALLTDRPQSKSSGMRPLSSPTAQPPRRTAAGTQEVKERLGRSLKVLQDKQRRLVAKKSAARLDNESQEEDLTAARDQAEHKCVELQDWLTRARNVARSQLTEVSVQGDSATKRLQAVISKEEKFLRVAEICGKLETKHDLASEEDAQTQPPAEHLRAALLRREAVRRRRDALSLQNKQLLFLLRQRDEDGVLEGRRAPLDVSPAPTTQRPPAADRRHVVIEAVHAVKHSL